MFQHFIQKKLSGMFCFVVSGQGERRRYDYYRYQQDGDDGRYPTGPAAVGGVFTDEAADPSGQVAAGGGYC